MPIPDVQTLFLPLLKLVGDGREHKLRELVDVLSDEFRLTPEERQQLLGSGQSVIYNRVGWARTCLKKAGLVEDPRWGCVRITDLGKSELANNLARMDLRYLEKYPGFVAFRKQRRELTSGESDAAESASSTDVGIRTPDEELEAAYRRSRRDLETDLLDQVKRASPEFFERLVVKLLVAMGYGGSVEDAGKAIGGQSDGGIDGTIKQDPLGLDMIFIQAKRWDSPVGRPEIQKFAGALQGQRARKGVFLTTGTFTREASEYVRSIESKIVLIDGRELAVRMVDHDVGVTRGRSFELKKLDRDYFVEEA